MAATGSEIITRAGILLNDEDHIRWTLKELCGWLNEGVAAIMLAKPSANSKSRVLHLVAGTLQSIAAADLPTPLALLDVPRNIVTETPRVGGRPISLTSRAILDAQNPYWHDPDRTRFASGVRHYTYDEQNPLEFYVYPGNDGTGLVEAVCSELPTAVTPDNDGLAIDDYDKPIGLVDLYAVPLVDYLVFRAQSKDDPASAPGPALSHYQQFANAIGLKIQVEGGSSPNSRRGRA